MANFCKDRVSAVPCDCVDSCKVLDDAGLPGLPAGKKELTSAEAFREATVKVSEALDRATAGLRAPLMQYGEDIKAIYPLFDHMSEEHIKRVVMFLEAAGDGFGKALQKELENAFE